MSAWLDAIKLEAQKELQKQGYQVFVKTSISPELKVFDSKQAELAGAGGGESFIGVGVTIKDKDGKLIVNYGGKPETNYLLTGSIIAFVVMVLFFFARGVVA